MMTVLTIIIWLILIYVIEMFLLGVIIGLFEWTGHQDIADKIEGFFFKKGA